MLCMHALIPDATQHCTHTIQAASKKAIATYVCRLTLFAWLISHQPTVIFSQNKPATRNQTAVLFSHNKPAPAISHQPTDLPHACIIPQ
jgi:hypothetical protein